MAALVEEEDDDDIYLGISLKDLHLLRSSTTHHHHHHHHHLTLPFLKKPPPIILRDPTTTTTFNGDDVSIFPPSNHENLTITDPTPKDPPSPFSPLSPLSFSPSEPEPSLGSDPDPPTSPPLPNVSAHWPAVDSWWVFAVRVLRSKIGSGFDFGRFGLVGAAAIAALGAWWWFRRLSRRSNSRESVGELLRIIRQKDEKIMQLLNQLAQMNEILLARDKSLTSKVG